MKIIVDAYGGDNAPLSVLQGAEMAIAEYGIEVVLSGKEKELKSVAQNHGVSLKGMSFLEAETKMPVEVEPSSITSEYSNSSLAIAIKALSNDEGQAVVSAGSTGAIVVGGIRWIRRIKGIRRPALGVVVPNTNGFYLLIDSGANAVARPEMLMQFGVMGSVYMQALMDIENPRVGMVNIGTEPNKGTDLQIDASKLLTDAPVNFIGNVEAVNLPLGGCDVAVADGFTGNIILKLTEGMAKMFMSEIKDVIYGGTLSKIGGLMIKKPMKEMAKKLDASEYGGVPLLGLTKPLVKAHGSSDALAIKNAIRQAKKVVDNNMIGKIEDALGELRENPQE